MSDEQPQRREGPVWRVNPILAALLILIGVVLLLPGLCSIYGIAMVIGLIAPGDFSEAGGALAAILPFVLLGLIASAAGIGLIVLAFRR